MTTEETRRGLTQAEAQPTLLEGAQMRIGRNRKTLFPIQGRFAETRDSGGTSCPFQSGAWQILPNQIRIQSRQAICLLVPAVSHCIHAIFR
jgi:hypothetical protein